MSEMSSHPIIDVSRLPQSAFGSRAPLWWGNTLLLFIETTMFALLAATYFYLRMDFGQWPPVQSNSIPPIEHPLPDLPLPSIILALQFAGCVTIAVAHRAALKMNGSLVRAGIALSLLLGIISIVLRFYEFPGLHFRWDDNAYGSITWMILGMHLFHLLALNGELAVVASYVFTHPLNEKKALDVSLTAIYWYWVAGMWVIFYLIVYWSPRWY
jgi:heme/copper-type cytochrome/quinol oxidase subunit 3